MKILISNDDGIDSPGIQLLTRIMRGFGDVTVVAPDGGRSGMSNAFTVGKPLRMDKISEEPGLVRYVSNGTPTDCVKLGINEVFNNELPDLLVAGINHGANSSTAVLYSGTLGAVFEGCVNGILSIGFSLSNHNWNTSTEYLAPYIEPIVRKIISLNPPKGICFNVNAPEGEIKGIVLTRQCSGHWGKEFDHRVDPTGRDYYWLAGEYVNHEPEAVDTDEAALHSGFISLSPIKIDMTAHEYITEMEKTSWDLL